MSFKVKFKIWLSVIILSVLFLNSCFSQGNKEISDLLKKWSSRNGTTVFDFRLPDTLYISSLDTSILRYQWKQDDNLLLIKDSAMKKFEKIAITYISADSLALKMAYPNDEVVFSFKPYIAPIKKFEPDSIIRFLSDKKFKATSDVNDFTYDITFIPGMKILLKGYNQEWRIGKNEEYVYMILETYIGMTQCFKVIDVSEKYIEWEVDDISNVDKVFRIRFTVK